MNSQITKKFIWFFNERKINELRPIDMVDRVNSIMDISKVILKEEARVKTKECLEVVSKYVADFSDEFERVVLAGLCNCWYFLGELTPWEQYH